MSSARSIFRTCRESPRGCGSKIVRDKGVPFGHGCSRWAKPGRWFRRSHEFSLCVGELIARCVSTWLPRDRDLWAFGTRSDQLNDHSIYLFDDVRRTRPDINAVWISGNRNVVDAVRATGAEAHVRWSWRGVRTALSAGAVVYTGDARDVNFAVTGGAVHVNLYHGIPLKQIEFSIETEPAHSIYHPRTLRQRLRSRVMFAPKFSRHDILAVPSTWGAKVMTEAFGGALPRSSGQCRLAWCRCSSRRHPVQRCSTANAR